MIYPEVGNQWPAFLGPLIPGGSSFGHAAVSLGQQRPSASPRHPTHTPPPKKKIEETRQIDQKSAQTRCGGKARTEPWKRREELEARTTGQLEKKDKEVEEKVIGCILDPSHCDSISQPRTNTSHRTRHSAGAAEIACMDKRILLGLPPEPADMNLIHVQEGNDSFRV